MGPLSFPLSHHLALVSTSCWPTIFDADPTLKQYWLNDLCLLGISYQPGGETSPVFVFT